MGVVIDRFSSADHLRGKSRTYQAVKDAVLNAGRFSTFEASDSPELFRQLERDPDIETFAMGYPWHGVRLASRTQEGR
jgi:hypothetical protein